jgi:hypothetical protein
VTSNQTDLVKLLIELGADVNQRDGKGEDGLTAADMARKYNHAYMATLLERPVRPPGRDTQQFRASLESSLFNGVMSIQEGERRCAISTARTATTSA